MGGKRRYMDIPLVPEPHVEEIEQDEDGMVTAIRNEWDRIGMPSAYAAAAIAREYVEYERLRNKFGGCGCGR